MSYAEARLDSLHENIDQLIEDLREVRDEQREMRKEQSELKASISALKGIGIASVTAISIGTPFLLYLLGHISFR